ncbi:MULTISPECIES: hypothetical protein [unclassified Rhizobium]|uniref:hypothetical protein n=1 Tax=unclassified Rhizobium TaxID=2613769 RepID=UPI000A5018DF|nr:MULTISPECIES: hypothetical protein [unclassified Rhizobium]
MNRKILARAVVALVLSSAVRAAETCDRWESGDSGVGTMMASICTGVADKRSELLIECGGKEKISLRYIPYRDIEPEGNSRFVVDWITPNETVSLKMLYEADDGALAAYPTMSDRIIELLKTGDRITARSTDGKYGPDDFKLAGSSKAFAIVRKSCPE